MALAGIGDSVSLELSILLGASVFAINTAQPGAQERLRPNQIEEFRGKADFVSLSAEALKLSKDLITARSSNS